MIITTLTLLFNLFRSGLLFCKVLSGSTTFKFNIKKTVLIAINSDLIQNRIDIHGCLNQQLSPLLTFCNSVIHSETVNHQQQQIFTSFKPIVQILLKPLTAGAFDNRLSVW